MSGIRNILYPTDFSSNAEMAIPLFVDLIRKGGCKLFALHALDVPFNLTLSNSNNHLEAMETVSEHMRSVFASHFERIMSNQSLIRTDHEAIILEGNSIEMIQEAIDQYNIDLVIMGARGKTNDQTSEVGSVSKTMIHEAKCPVIVVPQYATVQPIQRIAYGTDLTHDDTHEINFLIELAKLYNAKISLVYIYKNEVNRSHDLEKLDELHKKFESYNLTIDAVKMGRIRRGLLDYVRDHDVDMLAVTTQTITFFDKLFHRSIADWILKKAQLPVLFFNRKKYSTIFLG